MILVKKKRELVSSESWFRVKKKERERAGFERELVSSEKKEI